MSQAVVEFDVPARMRDGIVLRANVYRPVGEGRWPVLLTRLPYGKDLPAATGVLDPMQAVRRGYAVVIQDVRGRFASEGTFRAFHEAEDGYDTVAWAAGLPFSDGRVGMYGASYFGFTQWAAAAEQPPGLGAIVPYVSTSDPLNGLCFRGGAYQLGMSANWYLSAIGLEAVLRRHGGDPGRLMQALRELVAEIDGLARGGFAQLPLEEYPPIVRQGIDSGFFEPIRHPMDAAALAYMDISSRYDRVRVPTLNVGGWYDIFLQQTIASHLAMRQRGIPSKLLIGPWAHAVATNPIGEVDFGFAAQAFLIDLREDFGSLQLRWFDRWLKGLGNGIDEEPAVKFFVMGSNRWREVDDWPPPYREVAYHLHPAGLLSPAPPTASEPDTYTYDPQDPVPTRGGATLLGPSFPPGPRDQRPIEARPDVLTYTTPPLERDLEVTGPVRVRLWATSTAPDTDFVARLCDVFPDGRSIDLTDGIVRARYRHHPRPPAFLEPGRPVEYDIDLWSTSNVFAAGHRIRLQVTSSCFPRWDRNPNTGAALFSGTELRAARQQILHDPDHPSRLLLPVAVA